MIGHFRLGDLIISELMYEHVICESLCEISHVITEHADICEHILCELIRSKEKAPDECMDTTLCISPSQ